VGDHIIGGRPQLNRLKNSVGCTNLPIWAENQIKVTRKESKW